ncbi:MAG: hypothetical protein FJZ38_11245 [Candidatus Rokubacteria bacterium]|nr:hypothetical protein [Candidatus Rokubacteria bacterium]
MPDDTREPVTLETLHRDMQVGFADLKSTLISGFRGLPGRETAEEMVRLLREGNRIQETRLIELDVLAQQRHMELDTLIRRQHLETHQILGETHEILRAMAEEHRGTRQTLEDARVETQQALRALSEEIRRLAAQIRALIRGRRNGGDATRG